MKRNAKTGKKPKIIKITPEQLLTLTTAIRDSNLGSELGEMLISMVSGNQWLIQSLEKGQLSIQKLRKLFNITTESFENRRKTRHNEPGNTTKPTTPDVLSEESSIQTEDESALEKTPTPPKGHGRLAADAYEGAVVIDVDVPHLSPGDDCPEDYCDGRLYEMSEPGVMIQVTGNPMAQATRYNLQKLRCSLCELIFTAPLPEGVEDVKYTVSLIAMLMIHKYFISVPLYRQDKLQNYLGVPLPASTQWDLMAEQADVLKALYHAFEYDAAQGKGLAIDDTKARILEQIAKNKKAEKKAEKATCYTTGIVSAHDDHLCYVFVTDNQTAGKSVVPFIELRNKKLPPPYLMCDALTANIPEGISHDLYILCHCLTHARRQFYELPDGYDDLAEEVMGMIGKIYDHESTTKNMSSAERLSHHQTHSAPVMTALKTYLEKQAKEFEPNGAAGAAIDYILKRWTELTQFLRHKDTPLDTNIVERALKLVIQLRKSALFYKTARSARIASYIQTALYSAAQNEINPYEYMVSILSNKAAVIKNPERWLPWNYKAEEGRARHDGCITPGCP